MKDVFDRLAPFLQDYIYNHWTELRDVQVAACEVIFNTDCNLLLASGTASGKTEAAFLPILSDLSSQSAVSVGVLYISPLKALINDQFYRLEELLEDAHIPVTKWHGDVGPNIKQKIIKNPQGILQTTPESLESMLMNKKAVALKLFSDLRFIIIDEVHYFMDNDRGVQLLCLLERLQKLIGHIPRRVGLSATLGDYTLAEEWFNSGTLRPCITPKFSGHGNRIKLAVEHFSVDKSMADYYKHLYHITEKKRCIVFANSRSAAEESIAELKSLAKENHTKDIYHVHHGSISASLREDTEKKMKEAEEPIVTAATLTLELGIDIGDLERIVQLGSPLSVSSFVQRLGRTGRRGKPSEMCFMFKEGKKSGGREFYNLIHWEFIKCIAMIQLSLEERWIEPAPISNFPYGILYHQTISFMTSMGEVPLPKLAQNMLTLSPFKAIPQTDYKILLRHLIEINQLELTEGNNIIIGTNGEDEINHYEFYAVFEATIEYSVRSEAEEIGNVGSPYPVGEKFALAGRTWEVIQINKRQQEIYVEEVKGKSDTVWQGLIYSSIHTKVMKKMQEVLVGNKEYQYLGENAALQLQEIRNQVLLAGLADRLIIKLSEDICAVFPWLGTKAVKALSYSLEQTGYKNRIWFFSTIPVFILVDTSETEKLRDVISKIKIQNIEKHGFRIKDKDLDSFGGKFARFIPKELLKKQYIEDFIDVVDMQENLL